MFQRTLPTLKFSDYGKAAKELELLSSTGAQLILRAIGSNKCLSRISLADSMSGHHMDEGTLDGFLYSLLSLGVIIGEHRLEEGVCGYPIKQVAYFRVNWKQIRQINKAISLL